MRPGFSYGAFALGLVGLALSIVAIVLALSADEQARAPRTPRTTTTSWCISATDTERQAAGIPPAVECGP